MAEPDSHAASDHRVLSTRTALLFFGLASVLLAGWTWSLGSHPFQRSLDQIPWFELMHGVTALGDGGFALVIALWLTLRGSSRSEWIVFVVGFAAAALVPQIGKNFIWPDAMRPYAAVQGLRLSQVLDPALYKSFPSGHSSVGAFFALFLAYRKPSWRWLYIMLGIAVGLSRLALHYHWTEDVVAGWTVGLCSAWLAERTLGPKLNIHGTT
jgi:membrane-associated phospholipid phosphatase